MDKLTETKSKVVEFSLGIVLVVLGIALLTAILSIRSWYKPSIKLSEASPMTISLTEDYDVKDILKTNEEKEKAKQDALENVSNRRILKIDDTAVSKSVSRLAALINVSRRELNHQSVLDSILINTKVPIETQSALLELAEADFIEFKSIAQGSVVDLEHVKFAKYLKQLNRLLEIERKDYVTRLSDMRNEIRKINEAKDSLGKAYFEELKRSGNHEYVFAKALEVQKKLFDLGIVSGLPKDKILENVDILYPQLTASQLNLIKQLIKKSTLPNIRIDWIKVHELEREAMEAVPETIVTLKAGVVLVEKGRVPSEKNYYYLQELNMLHPEPNWRHIFSNLFFIASSFLTLMFFIFILKLKKYSVREIAMMLIATGGIAAITALISLWGINKLALIPLATLPMLLTVFYMPIMAGVLTTLMSFFLYQSFDLNFWQILPLYAGSIFAIFLTRKAHQREDFTNAGTKVAICQVFIFATTIMLAVENFKVVTVLVLASLYALSGFASGFITLAILPYLETSLRLLTPFKLAELSNPNQTLLRKLKDDAPGTYQHSLAVLNYAEEACRAINANTELLRVGILYHDIGKTYKPDYFIENQMGKPNPHTTLNDPQESAQIILAHVSEGIKLAKKHNLPQAIIDFIPMHQGTTITNYFYYQAIEKYGENAVNSEDFRYPGPKPNTKETGIMMLADSIEATIKSMKDLHDEATAMSIINKIIAARLNEGELDSSGLDRADLDKAAESFLRVWRTQNHERVKYPESNTHSNSSPKASPSTESAAASPKANPSAEPPTSSPKASPNPKANS